MKPSETIVQFVTSFGNERQVEATEGAGSKASCVPRSFFRELTPEQQKKALEYTGPDAHGGEEFRASLQPQ